MHRREFLIRSATGLGAAWLAQKNLLAALADLGRAPRHRRGIAGVEKRADRIDNTQGNEGTGIDRARDDLSSEIHPPEQRARAGVKRLEMALASAGEQHV